VRAISTSSFPEWFTAIAGSFGGLPDIEFFVGAVLFGLVVSGAYVRRCRAQATVAMLRGSALAAVLVVWQPIQVLRFAESIVLYALVVVATWSALSLGRIITRFLMHRVISDARLAAPAVVVSVGTAASVPGQAEVHGPDRDYRVVSRVSLSMSELGELSCDLEELAQLVASQRVEAVIATSHLPQRVAEQMLDVCLTAGCEFLYSARSFELVGVRPSVVWRGEEPFFELGTPVFKAQQLLAKRCLDLLVCASALLVVMPVLVLAAIAIKIDSPGPIFFAQHRVGLGGRRFRMWKLRTMRLGAEDEKLRLAHLNRSGDSRLFKIPDDPRVTRVGALLRRWSLDELPQIFNILCGHMSLVGPRPFFESDLDDYEAHHFRRLGAKPGLTGLWQISGRSNIMDFEEVVRLDRQYIEQWSLWLDLSILLRTIPAVLERQGAC
jgi:exopolysaccharide biosynthesis polyprenyl glycosylphosphotransferase